MNELDRLRERLKLLLQERPPLSPEFEVAVGWAGSYADLLVGKVSDAPSASVLERARATGRVLLLGPAGSGKTQLLWRVLRRLSSDNVVSAIVDFSREFDAQRWSSLSSPQSRIAYIVGNHALPRMSLAEFDSAARAGEAVLLVDGLNEVPNRLGQEVLVAIDEYLRTAPRVSAIVSDRLTRRELLREDRWNLGRVQPLSPAAVKELIGRFEPHLALPLFLEAQLKSADSSGDFADSLVMRTGLSSAEKMETAEAAFAAYKRRRSRIFHAEDFPKSILVKLRDSGLVNASGDGFCFVHHFVHDHFAALYFAKNPQLWDAAGFDAITFEAGSFDVLGLVSEQADASAAEMLLRRLYDWNLYAAAYVLAEKPSRVRRELGVAVGAMIAERQLDRFVATAQRARDGLLRIIANAPKREDFEPLLMPPRASPEELGAIFAALRGITTQDSEFNGWRELFCTRVGAPVSDHVVNLLISDDSIAGWAAANVVKRVTLTASQEKFIRGSLSSRSHVVRWRAAHSLGALPGRENVAALNECAERDSSRWVRYGSMRSLVEIALRSSSDIQRRATIALERLARAHELDNPIELARMLVTRNPPTDWPSVVQPILIALASRDDLDANQEAIERIGYEMRTA